MTHFAILMDVNAVSQELAVIEVLVLTYMTKSGLSLSVVALAMTILAFSFLKNVKNTRTIIHRNLRYKYNVIKVLRNSKFQSVVNDCRDFIFAWNRIPRGRFKIAMRNCCRTVALYISCCICLDGIGGNSFIFILKPSFQC